MIYFIVFDKVATLLAVEIAGYLDRACTSEICEVKFKLPRRKSCRRVHEEH